MTRRRAVALPRSRRRHRQPVRRRTAQAVPRGRRASAAGLDGRATARAARSRSSWRVAGRLLDAPPAWLRSTARRCSCVAGGATRQASVALALAASPARSTTGSWPCTTGRGRRCSWRRSPCGASGRRGEGVDGAVLGRPLADTLKRLDDGRIVDDRRPRQPLPRRDAAGLPSRGARAGDRRRRRIALRRHRRSVARRAPARCPHRRGRSRGSANPKVTTRADLALVESLLRAAIRATR